MKRTLRPLAAAAAFALAAGILLCGARGAAQPPEEEKEGFGPEILHIPLLERRAEQGILRPVPIQAELPRDIAVRARRVLVHYRLWGEPDWTTLEMRRSGTRYEGVVPCLEISTVTGDLRYYIRVHDVEGHVIASAASRAAPYIVTIKHDTTLAGGHKQVAKCPDPADCPRGLPGCPSEQVVEIQCQADSDCEGGLTCSWRGVCERGDRRKNWISLAVEQDFGLVNTTGGCSVYAQERQGYACYRADGVQYIGSPVYSNEPVGGGLGPTRVLVGFERVVYFDTSIGVRAGWAVAGQGPTPRGGTAFVPVSASVRLTHWFGNDLFARSGFRPFAFVTGGYAMVDVKTSVHIREDPTQPAYQANNDLEQTVDVWKRAGDGFVGLGGGLAFAFSTRWAAVLDAGVVYTLPFGALVIAPSAGIMVGF